MINEIFKFPAQINPFHQLKFLFEFSCGYPNYLIKKWCIWARFQISRKKFRKLHEAIWPTLINKIYNFPPQIDPFSIWRLTKAFIPYRSPSLLFYQKLTPEKTFYKKCYRTFLIKQVTEYSSFFFNCVKFEKMC